MASACLVGLPKQIIGRICAMLCPHCTNCTIPGKELYNLILTCKALYNLAQPVLYHGIYFARHILLLRTLIERPDLASNIRTFSSEANNDSDLSEADFSTIEISAARLRIILPAGWRTEMCESRNTIPAYVFDLLLGHLTAIETLEYTCSGDASPAELLSKSNIVLPSLRHLYISYGDTEGGFDLENSKKLFKIAPNIDFLHAHTCAAISSDLSLGHVKSLHFEYSFLKRIDVEHAIKACPLLEQFSFKYGGA